MKTQTEQKIKLSFPLYLYLQQLFTPDIYVKFINPFSFWCQYRINHLEACWEFNTVRHLENCLKIDSQIKQYPDNQSANNLNVVGIYRGLPWEKNSKNTLLIAQPSLKLKYRGITYQVNQISGIDIQVSKTKSQAIASDSLDKIIPQSNNSYTSQSDSTIS